MPYKKLALGLGSSCNSNGVSIDLVGQTCHILFSDRRSKLKLLQNIKSPNSVCIFNCGKERFLDLPDNHVVVDHFSTFDALLDELKGITEIDPSNQDHFLNGRVLDCIVLDNLSIYYWDLKILNQDPKNAERLGYRISQTGNRYYNELLETLNFLRDRYKCNIVTTTWDSAFERGFGYNGDTSKQNTGKLDALTFLPNSFLSQFDYLVHMDISGATSVYDKYEKQWQKLK